MCKYRNIYLNRKHTHTNQYCGYVVTKDKSIYIGTYILDTYETLNLKPNLETPHNLTQMSWQCSPTANQEPRLAVSELRERKP